VANDPDPVLGGTEPFPGYNDASVEQVKKQIAQAPEGAARETLKETIRAAEYAREGEPRQGVIAATEPAPAPDTGDGEPAPEDTSGRPDLAEVAEERAANRNVRVIGDAQKEA
jgi:hypothetical protein